MDDKRSPEKSARPEGIRKGRFTEGMDPVFSKFNASISFDKRLAMEDVAGSIAHVRMLAATGIIDEADASRIEKGLVETLDDIQSGRVGFRDELEDVHINIEEELRKKIGDVAGRLHTARSRNDQVALDFRLHVLSRSAALQDALIALLRSLSQTAEQEIDTIMPGYTHLQRAQPVRLAHHLLAYCEMFKRDLMRLSIADTRTAVSPLGAAALAGTTFDIDTAYTAREIGFHRTAMNSMDAVSDRDFALEFLFNCSMVMMHLSRLAEELILWSTAEFGFAVLPDGFCSGSSIMPQKKNPDACELIRGKTGRVYGDLISLLTVMKALPLTYNKDLQEDKEPVFDAADTTHTSTVIMSRLIPGIEFNRERMHHAASDPMLAATDLADELVREGVPFREAHARVGALMREGAEGAIRIPTPEDMVEARSAGCGTARDRVYEQLDEIRAFIAARNTGKAAE